MEQVTNALKTIFQDRLKEKEPLAKHLNYRIGGPARWFVEAKTIEEIEHAIRIAKENDVEYFVLGGGSNTLASDDGFDGVIIKMAMREYGIDGNLVWADAGVISAVLARQTAKAGLAGFTWAISLPGTIGGAVRGNAGCFGGETKDYFIKADVLRDGRVIQLNKEQLAFAYRESSVKHSDDIVLRAYFELPQGDPEALMQELNATLQKRKTSQPLHAGSAGCIFKNYEIKNEEDIPRLKEFNVPQDMLDAHRISAGWVVDHLELKGKKIGDAMISEEHGNFLINLGSATASDIVQLISFIKTKARKQYGIQLQEEIKYLGF